ncbi:MAG: metallophosphoesterase [Myxococcales bacterium]|nr:metallophosphoesterase [Myxococcales bacterium]
MTISSRFVVGWSGWALGAALALGACGESSPFDPRTDHETLVPEHARLDTPEPRNASRVDERESLLAEGWGEVSSGPGETHVARVLGGGSAPATGAQPVRLAAFVHLADIQLTDDESPGRVARIDGPGITSAAYRPHDAYSCHLLAAMTRSIHTVDAALRDEQGVGLDFVLLGGDNIDNAQTNELRYLQELLGPAATVECDSGADDDPVPGLQPDPNDPKDPFDAPGLALPYYWVTGNHDVLVQGNLVPNALSQAEVTGGTSVGFARDWSQPGGPLGRTLAPDSERAYLSRAGLLEAVMADGSGHGVGAEQAASGRATYAFDVPDSRLRVIVVDSSAPRGAAGGVILHAELEGTIRPLFEAAAQDGKWVIVTAHHASASLGDGSGTGGAFEADAITPEEWNDFLSAQPHLLLSLVAHSHRHRLNELSGAEGSVFELLTASLADFPHQARVMEVTDEDNGYVRVRATCLNVSVQGDPVAAEGLRLGVLDYAVGWADSSESTPGDRNVDLYVPRPAGP